MGSAGAELTGRGTGTGTGYWSLVCHRDLLVRRSPVKSAAAAGHRTLGKVRLHPTSLLGPFAVALG